MINPDVEICKPSRVFLLTYLASAAVKAAEISIQILVDTPTVCVISCVRICYRLFLYRIYLYTAP